MILFEIFRRDKIQRFFLTLRQEGLKSALAKTRRYLGARLRGNGLTGLFHVRGAPRNSGAYMVPVWLELAEKNAFHVTQAPALVTRQRRIAMVGDLNLPQCRKYRVEQPDELWRQANVDYSHAHYEDIPRAVSILQDATHVMFYRLAGGPVASMLAYEARRLRLPILYDLDDPLFSVSAYGTYQNMKALPAWRQQHFISEAPKYLDAMNAADMVSVATPGMATHTRLFTPRPVHVRRNFADQSTLRAGALAMAGAARDPAAFRVAFASGSQGHEIDFAEIQQDIATFLDRAANRQLVILGHFDRNLLPASLRNRIEAHPFSSYDEYLRVLASVDVAVMPLADDLFNRCKSAVRVIDAASVAVPSVVGTVSDMAAMVEDGISGRVLAPGESWAQALEDIAGSGAAAAMGQAARANLEQHWSARLDQPVIDREIVDWVRG